MSPATPLLILSTINMAEFAFTYNLLYNLFIITLQFTFFVNSTKTIPAKKVDKIPSTNFINKKTKSCDSHRRKDSICSRAAPLALAPSGRAGSKDAATAHKKRRKKSILMAKTFLLNCALSAQEDGEVGQVRQQRPTGGCPRSRPHHQLVHQPLYRRAQGPHLCIVLDLQTGEPWSDKHAGSNLLNPLGLV